MNGAFFSYSLKGLFLKLAWFIGQTVRNRQTDEGTQPIWERKG